MESVVKVAAPPVTAPPDPIREAFVAAEARVVEADQRLTQLQEQERGLRFGRWPSRRESRHALKAWPAVLEQIEDAVEVMEDAPRDRRLAGDQLREQIAQQFRQDAEPAIRDVLAALDPLLAAHARLAVLVEQADAQHIEAQVPPGGSGRFLPYIFELLPSLAAYRDRLVQLRHGEPEAPGLPGGRLRVRALKSFAIDADGNLWEQGDRLLPEFFSAIGAASATIATGEVCAVSVEAAALLTRHGFAAPVTE